jgi:hypothetical protein
MQEIETSANKTFSIVSVSNLAKRNRRSAQRRTETEPWGCHLKVPSLCIEPAMLVPKHATPQA